MKNGRKVLEEKWRKGRYWRRNRGKEDRDWRREGEIIIGGKATQDGKEGIGGRIEGRGK